MFFEQRQLGAKRNKKHPFRATTSRNDLSVLTRSFKPLEFLTLEEIHASAGDEYIYDVECYPNFFFIGFKHKKSGKVTYVELSPWCQLDTDLLGWLMFAAKLVSFNGNKYDLPMIFYAMKGAENHELKRLSDSIILENWSVWDIEKELGIRAPAYINHIDLIEVTPLEGSLKLYSGRLHCQRMQDLPFNPHEEITPERADVLRHYCINDLDNTELLYNDQLQEIALRESVGKQYGLELRSKSDAQLAEAVIFEELSKRQGKQPSRPRFPAGYSFYVNVPPFIYFQTEELQRMLSAVRGTQFFLDENNRPQLPEYLEGLIVNVGGKPYKMGIGGLHSQETCIAHLSSEDVKLYDRDVASFYPRIILNQKLYPDHLGPVFLEVFEDIVNRRLAAKAAAKKAKEAGDKEAEKPAKVEESSLKITINGTYGKLGDPYSIIFSPNHLTQVCLTGQLSLLMLIELFECAGIEVVSANTDGIIIKCPVSRKADYEAIIKYWEDQTQYTTEETEYRALYSRDVNNYIAVKPDGTAKAKGVYSDVGSARNSPLSKNPEALICSDAVKAFLCTHAPIEKTIRESRDIRRFVSIKNVKGGAHKDGVFLGKVVRWYYAKGETGVINYITNGNTVAKTEGAKPLMDLPEAFPDDVNFDWYIREALEMLHDIGYYPKPKQDTFF